eukprot:6697458-Prymnesium_polylepis.1
MPRPRHMSVTPKSGIPSPMKCPRSRAAVSAARSRPDVAAQEAASRRTRQGCHKAPNDAAPYSLEPTSARPTGPPRRRESRDPENGNEAGQAHLGGLGAALRRQLQGCQAPHGAKRILQLLVKQLAARPTVPTQDPGRGGESLGKACLGGTPTVLSTVPSGGLATPGSASHSHPSPAWDADDSAPSRVVPAWEAEPRGGTADTGSRPWWSGACSGSIPRRERRPSRPSPRKLSVYIFPKDPEVHLGSRARV